MEKISVKIEDKEILVNFWKTNKEKLNGIFYIHHGMAEHNESCLLYTSPSPRD